MATPNPTNFDTAARVAEKLVNKLSTASMRNGTVLNVNVPDVPLNQLRGLRVTRLGTRHPSANAIKQQSPRGDTQYWIGPAGLINDNSDDTDFFAVAENYVSVTPLTTDLTCVDSLSPVGDWLEQLS